MLQCGLNRLEECHFESFPFKEFPVEICENRMLTRMSIHLSDLFDIPREMLQLKDLTFLKLFCRQTIEIEPNTPFPENIINLESLEELWCPVEMFANSSIEGIYKFRKLTRIKFTTSLPYDKFEELKRRIHRFLPNCEVSY